MSGERKADVARELKTHILDSADALAADRKVPVTDSIVKEVLGKMGSAKKISAMYPTKKTVFGHDFGKALLSLAGIAAAFLAVIVILQLVSPDTLKMSIPGGAQDVLSVILSVVFALAIAIVVIAGIFLAMYVYETNLKTPYEARLKAFERSLNDVSSPINTAAKITGTAIWLALLNVFWNRVPFIQSFGDNPALVPLLTDKFALFVLYFNLIGLAGIILALSYLAIRQKWIPPIFEALLNLCNAVLFIWLLAGFPFNDALSAGPTTMIKFVLAMVVLGCLVATAKQLWDAMRFALYGTLESNDAV